MPSDLLCPGLPWVQLSMKFESQYSNFCSRKLICKHRMQNGSHIVAASSAKPATGATSKRAIRKWRLPETTEDDRQSPEVPWLCTWKLQLETLKIGLICVPRVHYRSRKHTRDHVINQALQTDPLCCVEGDVVIVDGVLCKSESRDRSDLWCLIELSTSINPS